MISSIFSSLHTDFKTSRPPLIFTLWIFLVHLLSSSSIKQTTSLCKPELLVISLKIFSPALPAP